MSIKLKANLNNPPISEYQTDAGCCDLQCPEDLHLVRLYPHRGLFMYTIYSAIHSNTLLLHQPRYRVILIESFN